MELTETRYADNGGVRIAYRTMGDGPLDLVLASNWFTNAEFMFEFPPSLGLITQLTTLGRFVFYDLPGTGVSDPIAFESMETLEQWTDAITTVLDAVGSTRAVLLAVDNAFFTSAMFAATYPSRTAGLVALGSTARVLSAPDYPAGLPSSVWEAGAAQALRAWGTGVWQHVLNPEMPWNEAERQSWARFERLTVSPAVMERVLPLIAKVDIRDLLPSIRVPTLVLHHTGDQMVPIADGRYIAEHIPGATFVEVPGRNHYLFAEPAWRTTFEAISEFITGSPTEAVADDRILATVLFTDIVGSTERAAVMGDREWRGLLDAHDTVVRAQLARFRGREVKTVGDGFLATFDGPQRAIRCAQAIRDAVRSLGLEVRAGLHTGECEVRGEDVGGLAVHIGARIAALAGAGEILVSRTLVDLVVGAGLSFSDRGETELKGVPGTWRVYSVV